MCHFLYTSWNEPKNTVNSIFFKDERTALLGFLVTLRQNIFFKSSAIYTTKSYWLTRLTFNNSIANYATITNKSRTEI